MKRRSIIYSALVFALSLSVTVGCSNPTSEIKAPTNSKVGDVKLGFSNWPGWAPWEVAQAKNIFQDNKVGVDLQWFTDYPKSLELLNTNKIDANNQGLSETIRAVANGTDLVVVLTTDNSIGNDQIIVSDKIKSITDLKGKKVAVEEGSVDHFLLSKALQRAGMTLKDVQPVFLVSEKAANAFVAGKVEAAVVYTPDTTTALKRPGSRELLSSMNFPGSISDQLVFTRKFVNEHPDRVQAIVNSWFATLEYTNSHKSKDEATGIMAKRIGVSPAEYKDYSDGIKMFSVADNIDAFLTGDDPTHLSNTAKEVSKFLFDNKLIKTNSIDTTKLFDDRFVKAYAAKKLTAAK